MKVPTVSIIIPTFNCSPYIAACLDSVMRQSLTDWECLLINDGSTDTPELERAVAPYRARLQYLVQANSGVSAARNAGLRIARAPIVAFVDADNVLYPDFLEVLTSLLDSDRSAVLAYGNAIAFGDHVNAGQTLEGAKAAAEGITLTKLLLGTVEVNSNLVARRDVVVAAGLFDPALRTCEDFDLWLRLSHRGGCLLHTHRVVMAMRLRGDSLSAAQRTMMEDTVRVLDKCEATMTLTDGERAAVGTRRQLNSASWHLLAGKEALAGERFDEAVASLSLANDYFRTRKLRLVVAVARFAPWLIRALHNFQHAWIFRPRAHLRMRWRLWQGESRHA